MHVYQFVAVVADDEDEALGIVDEVIHDEYSPFNWSDWCEVGGRWRNEFGEVISYATDPDAFTQALERAKTDRAKEVEDNLSYIKDLAGLISDLKTFDGEVADSNSDMYWLEEAIASVRGHGQQNAYFYDLDENTERFNYVRGRIITAPTKQHLIVVDFHF